MRKPLVAIVGRPNVGKSTLANRLLGYRQAIVDDMPGVTRDRIYFDVEWCGKQFKVVDTGGIIPGEEDEIHASIFDQVSIATKQADAIIFLVDGLQGVTPVDEDIANILRSSNKPVFTTVNKIDSPSKDVNVPEFYSLGMGELYPISASHGTGGVGDLLDALVAVIPDFMSEDEEEEEKIPKLAIVGRPNVGKSSITNFLIGEKRVIVSDKPGTTRDSIDTLVKYQGKEYILIDTAGIRKKSKVDKGIEYYSVKRALRSIRDSDITVLVVDSTEGITDQDKKIVEYSNEYGNALVIVMNKWDLIEEKDSNTINKHVDDIKRELPHGTFAEIIFTSALTGQRLAKIFEKVDKAFDNNNRKISTSLLNQVMMEFTSISPPQTIGGKRLKIYYSTQVDTNPPTFALFVNKSKLFAENYKRYLENKLRETFDFSGSPMTILVKEKTERAADKIKRKG